MIKSKKISVFKILSLLILIIGLVACGSGGSNDPIVNNITPPQQKLTPPNVLKLVSVVSTDTDKITLDWLPGIDDKTEHENLIYTIHITEEDGFKPDNSNQILSLTGQVTASVENLNPGTKYYVRLVAKDADGLSAWSNIMPVQTVSSAPKRTATKVVVPQTSQVTLVSENSITFKKDSTEIPEVGEILVSQEGNGYLRKVTEITQDNGTVTAKTESASLNEVFEELEFSTTVKMESIEDVATSPSKSIAKRKGGLSGRSSSKAKEVHWPDSGLTLTDSNAISSFSRASLARSTSVINDKYSQTIIVKEKYSKISAPAYIGTEPNKDFPFDVIVETLNPNEAKFQICDIELKSFKHKNKQLNKLPDPPIETMLSSDYEQKGKLNLRWNFSNKYIDSDGLPYTAIFVAYVNSRNHTCKDWYNKFTLQRWAEKIEVRVPVYVTMGEFTEDKLTKTLEFQKEAKATTSFDFRPELNINAKIENSHLQTANLTAKANVKFETLLELLTQAEVNLEGEMALLQPRQFIRVLQAGPVPIVVRGVFGIKAKLSGNITGSFDLRKTIILDFPNTEFGLTYDRSRAGERWQTVNNFEPVYQFKLEGDADAEAYVELRLIPDMQIHFYEAASSRMLVEPYIYGETNIHGQFRSLLTVDQTSTQYGDDFDYWFNRLAAGGGVDLRFYAGLHIFDINIVTYPEKAGGVNDIKNFELFTPIDKTDLWSLPKMKASQDLESFHPEDSRAIKILGLAENIQFPFGDEESLNPFEDWDEPKILDENEVTVSEDIAQIEIIEVEASDTMSESDLENKIFSHQDYWFNVTEPGLYNLRLSGHSEIGSLFRQIAPLEMQLLDEDDDGMMDYWEDRFGVSEPDEDDDCDGVTNIEEYNLGTFPNEEDSGCTQLNSKYIKISNSGQFLPESAKEWSCVFDNETGLIWESKSNGIGINDTYTNSSVLIATDPTEGPDSGVCYLSRSDDDGIFCHTEELIMNTNDVALCGFDNWRLPTAVELRGIGKFSLDSASNSVYSPDANYFGTGHWYANSGKLRSRYWTSTISPNQGVQHIDNFSDTGGGFFAYTTALLVRLVHD